MRKKLDTGLIHAMRAFTKVVDTGSFTAAATQMALTTSQTSRLVSDLEARLAVKLLQRSTHRRVLTDAGREYAERCREILAMIDEAEATASGTGSQPRGRLRVQCMASLGQHYVAPMLAEFCAAYPDLIVDYSTSQYLPDLLARGVDVSLYCAESLIDSGLVARRIGDTFSVLCASPAYLRQHGEPLTPDDLPDHRRLQLINPSTTADWLLITETGESRKLPATGQMIADTPDLLLDMAQQGAGIALLPFFTVVNAVRAQRLCHVLPAWRSSTIGVHALIPSRQFLEAKTRVWLDWVDRRIAPQLVQDAAFFTTVKPDTGQAGAEPQ